MSDISKQIVDQIANKEFSDAKDSIFQGLHKAAADTVDMKRVEMSTDWMNKEQEDENISTDQ
jgi:hypothetical protein